MGRFDTIRFTWKFLAPLPASWRLHQAVRAMLIPFSSIIQHLPKRAGGTGPSVLLDLGCGHGCFLALARAARPDLELVGLDLSEQKIDGARKAFGASTYPVRELSVRDIADFPALSVDTITILDVLYLVPMERWDGILQRCHDCLRPGGTLLLKEMDRTITWKFAVLYVEETLAVRVLGLTRGGAFNFPPPAQVRLRLERAGFKVEQCPIDRGYFVPHLLWIARKHASQPTRLGELSAARNAPDGSLSGFGGATPGV